MPVILFTARKDTLFSLFNSQLPENNMQLDQYVNTFGRYLKAKYQQRIKKLTIDAAFTCPNRDGSLGRGGCTFCNVKSFNSKADVEHSIASQIKQGKIEHGKKSEQ